MNYRTLFFVLIAALITAPSFSQQPTRVEADWSSIFEEFESVGTMVVLDQRPQQPVLQIYNQARAATRLSPASTYKIPHTLFALDSGAIEDEFQVFEWDGVERSYPPHNQDQNLRSA
ncbi:MAG: hypothetical protein MI746_14790, partial [Pseudomonadales bacterium]|nr:hypothetical protein [Pseudomonadales bacterium]